MAAVYLSALKGGVFNTAVSADGRTFTAITAPGAPSVLLRNGAVAASVTADAAGVLTYTFGTPQLATDKFTFAPVLTVPGPAGTLAAGTPVVVGTTFDAAGVTAGQTLSNGNRTLTSSTSSNPNGLRTVASFATGKRYIEFNIVTVATNTQIAIVASGLSMTNGGTGFAGTDSAVTIRWDGAIYQGSGFANPNSIGALANGDVIGVAVDRTNGVYYVRKNGGTWYGAGGSGKDPTVSGQGQGLPTGLTSATVYFAAIAGNSGAVVTMNPTPSSVPTGYSTMSSSTSPNIAVLQLAGQSNSTGTAQDNSSLVWTPDPLTVTWDGAKFVDYVPLLRTGFEFGQWDTAGNPGPEIGFITAFRAANPTTPLVIEKFCARGTQLASSGSNAIYDWAPGSTGELFPQATTFFTAAQAALVTLGYTPVITTLWVQGEQDASDSTMASNYQTNLGALVTAVRSGWGLGGGSFIISRLRAGAFATTVRTAQFNVAAANSGGPVGLIETTDLTVGTDATHYVIAALQTLGGRVYSWTQGTYTEPAS